MKKLLKVGLIISFVSVLLFQFAMAGCSSSSGPIPPQPVTEGNPAPNFQLDNLDGKAISLSELQGKPVLLNLWATWCYSCISEMPLLQTVHEEQSARGLVLLTINMGESSSKVAEFLESHNLSFPVLLDPNKDVARQYNIQYIPTTFFIDKDGIIQAVRVGAFPNKEAIEDDLNKIMP